MTTARKKIYLTPEGLMKGREQEDNSVVMVEKYDVDTNMYQETLSVYERRFVLSIDDINEINTYARNYLMRYWGKELNLRVPYIKCENFMGYYTTNEGGHPDGYSISETTIKWCLRNDKIDSIYLDFWLYEREGNPQDWGDWEPWDERYSVDLMAFEWSKDYASHIVPNPSLPNFKELMKQYLPN